MIPVGQRETALQSRSKFRDEGSCIVTRVVCVANQKGGVGKTTTAVNLAAACARSGRHVLLVDLDPQCNATTGLGESPEDSHPLVGTRPLREFISETSVKRLELLPGSRSFQDVEQLAQGNHRQTELIRDHFTRSFGAYDMVFIDCPPSMGHLTQAALAGSTEVLMPIQCEYFAMEGLAQMIEIIGSVIEQQDSRLQFGGIVLTMYEESLELTREVDLEVREFFGEVVYQTVIPRDVAVAESPSHGQPVIDYAPRARGTRAYMELCMEVLER